MARPKLLSQNKKGKLTYWCKKIDGKRHYFGNVETVTRAAAEREYLSTIDNLESGIEDSAPAKGAKLKDLYRHFYADSLEKHERGDLKIATLRDHKKVLELLKDILPLDKTLLSLGRADFQKIRESIECKSNGELRSPHSRNRYLQYCRTIFKYASDDSLFVENPLPYQKALKAVPKKVVRQFRQASAPRLLENHEIRGLIDYSDVNYQPALWLAINGGFNNSDLRHLKLKDLGGFEKGVLDYAREKTGIQRTTPLWPETIKSIQKWLSQRPETDHDYVFCSLMRDRDKDGKSKFGTSFVTRDEKHCRISGTVGRYLRKLGLYGPGKNFGAFRSTFADVGKQVGDDLSLKAAMGHEDGSVLYSHYARKQWLPRIQKITDHVRDWLLR